jgi:hypothetical protein
MKRPLLLLIPPLLLAAASCGDDDDVGRQDLNQADQATDTGPVTIVVSADGYPNQQHKCVTIGGQVIGSWTTTDRIFILIYNDWACEGSNTEQPMEIVTGTPRSVVNAGSG